MKIITAVVNNPIFIEIQYHTFKKYMTTPYEFIVFNDAKSLPDITNGNDITIKEKIEETCKKLDIKCINIPNIHHRRWNMSTRHADTFNNHILKYQINNPDKYLLIDSDMFLIDFFDSSKYDNFDCALVFQSREININNTIKYFWPGLCYLDFNKIKNVELLNWDLSPGCDTGGMMQFWLRMQMHKDQKSIFSINHLSSCNWTIENIPENIKNNTKLIKFLNKDPRNENGKYYAEIYDNIFFHYRAGGNWKMEGMDFHNKLSLKLQKCLL